MKTEWEYALVRRFKRDDGRAIALSVLLNQRGADGWELCGVLTDTFIFKRPKP
jgi:hypothetical protein